ncbi:MAG: polysaccharide deacetylase family protein [Planctomycetota bacterium]
MNTAQPALTFVPVTRDQARLFAGVARMLDRRGVNCRFAVPAAEVARELVDDWGPLVTIADEQDPGNNGLDDIPVELGAYDAWRGDWLEEDRVARAAGAMTFWRRFLQLHATRAVVLWNGRGHLFVEAAACAARAADLQVICLELGPLRQNPMTVAISRDGINAQARFRRPDKLVADLTPWEQQHLATARCRFRSEIAAEGIAGPYMFLPLQVDDDTQLFYYAPYFKNQREMVAAVVANRPANLPLIIKPHPLCDVRQGRGLYAPLLRAQDRIAAASTNTLELIAGAAAVITNNSSAGIEALMLERPVVVLGTAHYRGRGFTHDYAGVEDLSVLMHHAVAGSIGEPARDRYLYELLFHELVQLEQHPLRGQLSAEEYERLAIRLWDLVEPLVLGSDWQPVFNEIHALREDLRNAVHAALHAVDPAGLLVVSRFAQSCLFDLAGSDALVLEEITSKYAARMAERHLCLLAPELAAGQRQVVVERLRNLGAAVVTDLAPALSRRASVFHVKHFNQLPGAMRNDLYRSTAYWDYYLTHAGISPRNTPEKNTQAETLCARLNELAPRRLLEYGCGDGRILERLLAHEEPPWRQVVGVDSSERMLQLARARLGAVDNLALLPADARQRLPFDDDSFDATLTCGTLQHVLAEELPAVLSRLTRVTRKQLVHCEAFEAHQPKPGEHYTNPNVSRAIHRHVFEQHGPLRMRVEDMRPLTGQDSLLAEYDLNQPLITVLTLHAVGVPDPACEAHDYRNMFIAREQLAELVDGLRAADYQFMTLGEALAVVRGDAPPMRKTVVLTFDDGYASVAEVAGPLLEKRGIRAAAFIPTAYIGKQFGGNTRAGSGPAVPMMTADQIRSLHAAGWDIGAHSVSYPLFARLSADEARHEMQQSKACLEELLGEAVTLFAFPYGEPEVAYRPEHVEMAVQCGFELALSMRPDFVTQGCKALDWPRIGVGSDMTCGALLNELVAIHRQVHGWPAKSTEVEPSLKERVRDVVRRCVEEGVERIALYGAGRHTAKLLQSAPLWPLHVLGIVDDDTSLQGVTKYGLPVYTPADIPALSPDAVLISSDQFEDAIYERITPLEGRGISVLRLYGKGS